MMINWYNLVVDLRSFYHDATVKAGATRQLARLVANEITTHPRSPYYNSIDSIEHKLSAMCGSMWRAHPEYEPGHALGEALLILKYDMDLKLGRASGRLIHSANKGLSNG